VSPRWQVRHLLCQAADWPIDAILGNVVRFQVRPLQDGWSKFFG
jgi:hypothetical protein